MSALRRSLPFQGRVSVVLLDVNEVSGTPKMGLDAETGGYIDASAIGKMPYSLQAQLF